ncbi:MAG: hypothetical protein GEU80_03155 [Dehalococcoidia bacterium]|nr:hypothetical protein [Dehalococcoidia bacterium]
MRCKSAFVVASGLAALLVLSGCTALQQPETVTPTPARPAPRVDVVATVPRGTVSGVAEVDELIAAVLAGDEGTLRELLGSEKASSLLAASGDCRSPAVREPDRIAASLLNGQHELVAVVGVPGVPVHSPDWLYFRDYLVVFTPVGTDEGTGVLVRSGLVAGMNAGCSDVRGMLMVAGDRLPLLLRGPAFGQFPPAR